MTQAVSGKDFIRDRFFSLGAEEKEALFVFYGIRYGWSAEHYIRKTYGKWRAGEVKMSGETEYRLLSCVPRFLSDEDLFALVIVEVRDRINTAARLGCNFRNVPLSALREYFAEKFILERNRPTRLSWFTRDVLTECECCEFSKLANSIICENLLRIYQCVLDDLEFVQGAFGEMPYTVDIDYRVPDLNLEVCFDERLEEFLSGFQELSLQVKRPALYSRFHDQVSAFLVEKDVERAVKSSVSDMRYSLAIKDVQRIAEELSRLSEGTSSSSTLRLHIKGSAGEMDVRLEKLDVRRLQSEIFVCRLWQIGIVIVLVAIWSVIIAIPIKVVLSALLGVIGVSYFNEKIKQKKKEVIRYGRKNFSCQPRSV